MELMTKEKKGFKRTDIGHIPHDWKIKPLSSVIRLMTNGFVGRAKDHYTDSSDGVLYVQGYNVRENSIRYRGIKKVTSSFHKQHKSTELKEGDLLTVQTGDVGLTTIVPKELEGANCHALIITRFCKEVEPIYASYYINSDIGRGRLRELETGTTVKHINVGELKHWLIPLPPTLEEQQAIASALSDVDELIRSLDGLIQKKQAIKKGTMQQLLTGKKRLTGFDGEWIEVNMGKDASLKARIGWQGLRTEEYLDNGEYYLVTGTDFKNGRVDWKGCHYVEYDRYKQDTNIQLKEGDVLVTKDGTIGKVAIVEELNKPATLNSGVFVIRPTTNKFINEFLFYTLSSIHFTKFLDSLTAGSTINHLYQKDFVTYTFDVPPTIEEQKAIAQTLSDMDRELQTLRQKREKYVQIKQGMMQELLTGRTRLI